MSLSRVVEVGEGGKVEGEVEEVADLLVTWSKEYGGRSLIRSQDLIMVARVAGRQDGGLEVVALSSRRCRSM